MIAFHFPPCRGSSGLQRTLAFCKFLPKYGWNPLVLTVSAKAYSDVSDDQVSDVSPEVPVRRALALDTAKHLSFRGRYAGWMALPDRWVSWIPSALLQGLRLVRRYRPQVIWSTYPIATAHLIAYLLHKLTGIPWVADFRDPMIEINTQTGRRAPADPSIFRARSWVERLTARNSSRCVFVSHGALRIYVNRYRELPSSRTSLIPNGYDEEAFQDAERASPRRKSDSQQCLLLHSGTLYPTPDRDPTAFFMALGKLRASGTISPPTFKVILRATGYDAHYSEQIQRHGLDDIVLLKPAIPYREALAEMLNADGLLLFQGYTSNPAIPAKLYEYLRAQRPIYAMVDPNGDTAQALRSIGVGKIVPLVSEEQIASGLIEFLGELCNGRRHIANSDQIRDLSREATTRDLAHTLEVVASRALR